MTSALRSAPYSTLVKIFEQDGFRFDRQRGDHLIYIKPGVSRPLVIPAYREVPCSSSRTSFVPRA
ncbi:MAG: type II toxin-antitoxin system HicA family toxin [Terracidiphilus sp.]